LTIAAASGIDAGWCTGTADRLRRAGRHFRAHQPFHPVQCPVDAGQDPGGGDDVAVVDEPLPAHPAHGRVVAGEGVELQPVRGGRPAVEQAGGGEHPAAVADAQQLRAVGGLRAKPALDRLGARLADVRERGHDDEVGRLRAEQGGEIVEAQVGHQVEATGQGLRRPLRRDGVDVEPAGRGQDLVRRKGVGDDGPAVADHDHRGRPGRVVDGRCRGGHRPVRAGGVERPERRQRGEGRADGGDGEHGDDQREPLQHGPHVSASTRRGATPWRRASAGT
jgi:hypothetical protein